MYGHTHTDFFSLMKSKSGLNIAVAHVNPSLTTASSLNPSFRVYEMDDSSYRLLDYSQYMLDLLKSNKERVPFWVLAYRFTQYYGVPSMSLGSYDSLLKKMPVFCFNGFDLKRVIKKYGIKR